MNSEIQAFITNEFKESDITIHFLTESNGNADDCIINDDINKVGYTLTDIHDSDDEFFYVDYIQSFDKILWQVQFNSHTCNWTLLPDVLRTLKYFALLYNEKIFKLLKPLYFGCNFDNFVKNRKQSFNASLQIKQLRNEIISDISIEKNNVILYFDQLLFNHEGYNKCKMKFFDFDDILHDVYISFYTVNKSKILKGQKFYLDELLKLKKNLSISFEVADIFLGFTTPIMISGIVIKNDKKIKESFTLYISTEKFSYCFYH